MTIRLARIKKTSTYLVITMITMLTVLISCKKGQNPLLTKSGGDPYEVLVVCEKNVWNSQGGRSLYNILNTDVEGLPQPESAFKISYATPSQYNQITHMARNIVIVDVNPSIYSTTKIKYDKNVYAEPQMIIYINTPSAKALKKDIGKFDNTITRLLTRSEMNAAITILNRKYNVKNCRIINKTFNVDMKIPSDMKSIKRSDGFIWVSNNAPSGMQNICIYSYPINGNISLHQIIEKRDSFMRINIPGEKPCMYMHTVAQTVFGKKEKEKGIYIYVTRGLWEMINDDMGGPFVSHSIIDSTRKRVVVAEAFVYAPEMKKRNLIRQLEAALYTLKLK